MPGKAAVPTINSTRVMRAYRLNEVENVLLNNRLYSMGKEKTRAVRLNNQDIRLIKLTIDYIQSSSGQSREGRPPQYIPPPVERDTSGYFLYGDRIRSKKYGKQRRTQSAHVSFGKYSRSKQDNAESRAGSETAPPPTDDDDAEDDTAAPVKEAKLQRPKSSPVRPNSKYAQLVMPKLRGFRPPETGICLPQPSQDQSEKVTEDSDDDSIVDDVPKSTNQHRQSANPITSATSINPTEPTVIDEYDMSSDKRYKTSERYTSGRSRSRPVSSVVGKRTKTFVTTETPSPDPTLRHQQAAVTSPSSTNHSGDVARPDFTHRAASANHTRRRYSRENQELARRVNEERLQAATKPRPEPMQAWSAPAGSPQKMQQVMHYKEQLNVSRNQIIQSKLDAFKQQYPTKRY